MSRKEWGALSGAPFRRATLLAPEAESAEHRAVRLLVHVAAHALRLGDVRALERVEVPVPEAREADRQDLVGPRAAESTVLADHLRAVDRVVDRTAQLVVVVEQRLVLVHVEVP